MPFASCSLSYGFGMSKAANRRRLGLSSKGPAYSMIWRPRVYLGYPLAATRGEVKGLGSPAKLAC